MQKPFLSLLVLLALCGTIIAEEPRTNKGFYDSYDFSPQVIRSAWIDLDKAVREEGDIYTQLTRLVSYGKLGEWANMPIFIKGPHTTERMELSSKSDFGHYNRNFVIWARTNLIPAAFDDTFRKATQPLYDAYLKDRARSFFAAYSDMKTQQDASELLKKAYLEAMRSGEYYYFEETYPHDVITLVYPGRSSHDAAPQSWKIPFPFSKRISKYHALFWTRRTLDGTASEFALLLEKLLAAYDREFLNQTKSTRTK